MSQSPKFEIEHLKSEIKPTTAITILNSELIPSPPSGAWAIFSQSPVRHHPKRDVFNAVLIAVAKSYADLNVKSITPDERTYMVNELTDNIIARYPAIRINEIPEAIANGIRGKYGEFMA